MYFTKLLTLLTVNCKDFYSGLTVKILGNSKKLMNCFKRVSKGDDSGLFLSGLLILWSMLAPCLLNDSCSPREPLILTSENNCQEGQGRDSLTFSRIRLAVLVICVHAFVRNFMECLEFRCILLQNDSHLFLEYFSPLIMLVYFLFALAVAHSAEFLFLCSVWCPRLPFDYSSLKTVL